ncbi:MAG: A/G-specific adenine glycosylase [Nitrospirae bacterium]|nr:A/G-specific adenine glycosylase [Magnetococcales bacterium]HAT50195.1 A/G-specific adenine glycosylase [Alphaproteobacteria bacterium]
MIDWEFPYSEKLLKFYQNSGRHLPWRGDGDPYRIWVSEVMLQQTGVAAVKGYYDRFLSRFPTVAALGAADLQEVLREWQGMGYYRRAENLHRAARIIRDDLGGQYPETFAGWLALPGIGRSTAGAIMAIGFNRRYAILDGNCKRVLSRVIALDEPMDSSQGIRTLWHWATQLTPQDRPGDYAQAIMDLGALVCTPRTPRCLECPWLAGCRAAVLQTVADYPNRSKPKERPKYSQVAILVQDAGRVLLRKRPAGGLLAGLWEPLSVPRESFRPPPSEADQVVELLWQHWQVLGREMTMLGKVQHAFTHFHLTVWVYSCRYVSGWPQGEVIGWADHGSDKPVSSLHAKVLAVSGFSK